MHVCTMHISLWSLIPMNICMIHVSTMQIYMILDPDACVYDADMNDAYICIYMHIYIHDPWPWCMYPWCRIFSWRTDEPTNKSILGVGWKIELLIHWVISQNFAWKSGTNYAYPSNTNISWKCVVILIGTIALARSSLLKILDGTDQSVTSASREKDRWHDLPSAGLAFSVGGICQE